MVSGDLSEASGTGAASVAAEPRGPDNLRLVAMEDAITHLAGSLSAPGSNDGSMNHCTMRWLRGDGLWVGVFLWKRFWE